jgi:hypothetical protein
MNKPYIACTVLLAVFAADLRAAESAQLRVTGRILPSVCTPSFSSNEASARPYAQRLDTAVLAHRFDQQMNIDCGIPTRLVVRTLDNRVDSRSLSATDSGAHELGLGRDTAGNKIGRVSFATTSQHLEVNGQPAGVLLSEDRGSTWQAKSETYLYAHPAYSLSWHAADSVMPTPISTLSMQLNANVYIAPNAALTAIRDLNLDGAMTLELYYQ